MARGPCAMTGQAITPPLWRLIAETGVDFTSTCDVAVVHPVPNGAEWRSALSHALQAGSADVVVIAVERGSARTIINLLAHRRWSLRRAPSLQDIRSVLEDAGGLIVGQFLLWPSSQHPRLAIQIPGVLPLVWVQRSAVLGGGGHRVWTRFLARSMLFTPFLRLLTPGVALVVTRDKSGREG